jgi:hypothetical protein
LYWYLPQNNLVLTGGGISPSSQNTYFPAANIKHHLACDVWRAQPGNSYDSLTVDLGGAKLAADFPLGLDVLINSWNLPGIADSTTSFQIVLLPSATTYTYSLAQVLALDKTVEGLGKGPIRFNVAMIDNTTSVRIQVYKGVSPDPTFYWEVGKLFIGAAYDSSLIGGPGNNGFARAYAEAINRSYTPLRQRFSEQLANYWKGSISIPYLTEAIARQMRKLIFKIGTYQNMWVLIDTDSASTAELGVPRYVALSDPPTEKMVGYGADWVWGVSLNLEEQL